MTTEFQKEIITRLSDLGFILKEDDIPYLKDCIVKAESYFKNFCHIKKIPDELMPYLKDHCCGLFIKGKTSLAENNMVHSAKIGDVSLTFDEKSKENNNLIQNLFCPREVLMCYRKLSW